MYILPIKSLWVMIIFLCLFRTMWWVYKGGMKDKNKYIKIMLIVGFLIGMGGLDEFTFKLLNLVIPPLIYKRVIGSLIVCYLVMGGIGTFQYENNKKTKWNYKQKAIHIVQVIFAATFFAWYFWTK